MTTVLLALGALGSLVLMVLRSLVVDEVRGRIQRVLVARLERIIETLSPDLQDEWAEEWRAELAAINAMPLTAALWVRGVGRSALGFVGDDSLDSAAAPDAASVGPLHDILVEELELGDRSYSLLKRVGIRTVGDLISKSEGELRRMPNFGLTAIDEIVETLHCRGLDLRGD